MGFWKYLGITVGIILLFVMIFYASLKGLSAIPKLDMVETEISRNFYSEAYNNLISTHVGLFTALIAVAIAVFGVQKWIDRKDLDEVLDSIPQKIDAVIKEKQPQIVKESRNSLKKDLHVEVEKVSIDYWSTLVDVNLSILSEEQKNIFCKEFASRIYTKYFISSYAMSIDPFIGFKPILAKLFDSLKKEDLQGDEQLKDFMNLIKGKIITIKSNNYYAYKKEYENLFNKISSLI